MKRSGSKNPEKKAERERLVVEAHAAYLEFVESLPERAKELIAKIPMDDVRAFAMTLETQIFVDRGERQIDQIRRRVISGESIPHAEKVLNLRFPIGFTMKAKGESRPKSTVLLLKRKFRRRSDQKSQMNRQ